MEARKNMNNYNNSATGGVLIISLPSRAVSWVSPNKTLKDEETQMGGFKRTKHTHRRADGIEKWNVPSEDRGQHLNTPNTQQICHISADAEDHWSSHPLREEYKHTIKGKVFVPLYTPAQRFQKNLEEHFMYICEQAWLNPDRCSFSWNPTQSTK